MSRGVKVNRRILMRPERKPPQLLKLPFYEDAIAVFQGICDMPVSLELEVTTTFGEPTWTIAAYSGPRSFSGLTVNHIIPRTGKPLSLAVVKEAASMLGQTSRNAWAQRRRREDAKAALMKAGKRRGDVHQAAS